MVNRYTQKFTVILALLSFSFINANSDEVSRARGCCNQQQNSCSTFPNFGPSVPSTNCPTPACPSCCLVAGRFSINFDQSGEHIGPVCGCCYTVTPICSDNDDSTSANIFLVRFNKPFCSPVAVVASAISTNCTGGDAIQLFQPSPNCQSFVIAVPTTGLECDGSPTIDQTVAEVSFIAAPCTCS